MKLLGRELPIVRMPQRPGDITHSVADISKIVRLTRFKPTPLEEGLKKTINELKTYSTPEPSSRLSRGRENTNSINFLASREKTSTNTRRS
ncbi:MAG: hypothetical protein QXI86_06125 [Ignisphaera sp.]